MHQIEKKRGQKFDFQADSLLEGNTHYKSNGARLTIH